MFGEPRALDVAGGGDCRLAALGVHDIGGHDWLVRLEVVARAFVDGDELSERIGRLVQRPPRFQARRRLAQTRDDLGSQIRRRRHLWHPERHALTGGDVRLLARAQLGQRVGRLTGVKIECSRRRTLPSDVLFGTDEEETGGNHCEQRQRADDRSDRTGSHRNIAARVS